MSNWKLQGEVDRLLKRVTEGIDEFGTTWEKVQTAPSQNLKEKYGSELKKEIKKLQRFRDQIKTWVQSGELKKKVDEMMKARRAIEREMERFKVLERESKTKEYSKEGLAKLAKLAKRRKEDPRNKMYEWIESVKESLNQQMEELEEQMEGVTSRKQRGSKSNKKQISDQIQEKMKNHNWHIKQLDIVKNRLKSEEITINKVEKIKEDVEYYVDSNQDPEFIMDEYLYDALDEDDSDADEEAKESGESETEEEHRSTGISCDAPPPLLPAPKDCKEEKKEHPSRPSKTGAANDGEISKVNYEASSTENNNNGKQAAAEILSNEKANMMKTKESKSIPNSWNQSKLSKTASPNLETHTVRASAKARSLPKEWGGGRKRAPEDAKVGQTRKANISPKDSPGKSTKTSVSPWRVRSSRNAWTENKSERISSLPSASQKLPQTVRSLASGSSEFPSEFKPQGTDVLTALRADRAKNAHINKNGSKPNTNQKYDASVPISVNSSGSTSSMLNLEEYNRNKRLLEQSMRRTASPADTDRPKQYIPR